MQQTLTLLLEFPRIIFKKLWRGHNLEVALVEVWKWTNKSTAWFTPFLTKIILGKASYRKFKELAILAALCTICNAQWTKIAINSHISQKFYFYTSLDFNYVKPCLDLRKLRPQLLTLWLGVLFWWSKFVLFMKQIYVTMTRWYGLV